MEKKYERAVKDSRDGLERAIEVGKGNGASERDIRYLKAFLRSMDLLAEIADLNMEFNSFNKDHKITVSTMVEVTCGSLLLLMADVENKLPYFAFFGDITRTLIEIENVLQMVLPILAEEDARKVEKEVLNS